MSNTHETDHSRDWEKKQAIAEELVPVIGRLYRQHGIVLSVHGRSLHNLSPIDIVRIHRFARHVDGRELPIQYTAQVLDAIDRLNRGRPRWMWQGFTRSSPMLQ
jgi:glyceraldehyde 3-phosphate dehydrogenase